MKKLVILSSLLFVVGCSSKYIKERQAKREEMSVKTGHYCDFVKAEPGNEMKNSYPPKHPPPEEPSPLPSHPASVFTSTPLARNVATSAEVAAGEPVRFKWNWLRQSSG